MNVQLKNRIEEKLEHLSDKRVAEVLDFLERLEARERLSAPLSNARESESSTYLAGVEQTLNEWSSDADERAYHVL
jgi:hypothetical protein